MSISGETKRNRSSSKAFLYGERILLIFSPVLLLFIQSFKADRNLWLSVPVWSDELDYWREMFSFANNGFSFGGSMFVGYDAALGPFGAHSFSPVAAWGLFAPLFRSAYSVYAILWANMVLVSLAWLIFVYLIKPDIKITFVAMLSAYVYPMFFLYAHSSMIEMVCMAELIIYFSLLYKWEREEETKWFVLLMIVGIWCVCVRVTYVVILFPVIWKKVNFKFNLKAIFAMTAYVVLFLGFYKIYNLFCAGYPGWVTEKIHDAVGVRTKLAVIFYNTKDNLIRLLSPFSADRAQVGMRYFYLIMLLFLIGAAVRHKGGNVKSKVNMLFISLAVMMTGLLTMMVMLYDIKEWRDFRTFAPIAYGVFLFLILSERNDRLYRIFLYSLFVFVTMMSFSSGVDFIKEKGYERVTDRSALFEEVEAEDEKGNPRTIGIDMDNNWCDISFMSSVPSKMGVQIFYDDIDGDNIRMVDYVLLSDENYSKLADLFDGYEVRKLGKYGRLIKVFE